MSDDDNAAVKRMLDRTIVVLENITEGTCVCLRCALKASVEHRDESPVFNETAAAHIARCHSDPAQLDRDRELLFNALKNDYHRDMQLAEEAQPKVRELFRSLIVAREGKVEAEHLIEACKAAGMAETVAVLAAKKFARAHNAGRAGAVNN